MPPESRPFQKYLFVHPKNGILPMLRIETLSGHGFHVFWEHPEETPTVAIDRNWKVGRVFLVKGTHGGVKSFSP